MFDNCIIKTIPTDAKSREEQDGGKHSFVERSTAELQAICKYVYRIAGKFRRVKFPDISDIQIISEFIQAYNHGTS